jgi:hypothetical protein
MICLKALVKLEQLWPLSQYFFNIAHDEINVKLLILIKTGLICYYLNVCTYSDQYRIYLQFNHFDTILAAFTNSK